MITFLAHRISGGVARAGITAAVVLLTCSCAIADVVYLKNGNTMEGIIKREDADSIDLELGFGTTRINKSQIDKIIKATADEERVLHTKWELRKLEQQEAASVRRLSDGQKLLRKSINFIDQNGHVIVTTLINKKVEATLLMDTGASVVVLSEKIAKDLGFDISKEKRSIKVQVADGRMVDAKVITLGTMSIENAVAENVEAAVLTEAAAPLGKGAAVHDGLLGMSFLKQFNFQVDQKNQKLVLEKLQ